MLRCAALVLAATLVGCSQSPSSKEPGPRSSATGRKKADGGEAEAPPAKKAAPAGVPTEPEVRAAAKTYLERQGSGVKDVQVTFVSAPLELPEKKREELGEAARDARAYYAGFTAT